MRRAPLRMFFTPLLLLVFVSSFARTVWGYSVLTHETIIDSSWNSHIVPILRARFPGGTPEELREARAYAYGGCIIQDSGYYPFGSHLFTDLAHYVRSGDLVEALIAEAHDRNELAFALGALAHYCADNTGHPPINRATAVTYPKLGRKFGKTVTYADSPNGHVKMEFGFDVLQVARGRYTAEAYHDFIGFAVAKELLERGFARTYGLPLKDLFFNFDLALGTYRWAVGTLIPELTRVAWEVQKDDIQRLQPEMTREKFVRTFSRAQYEKDWGKTYKRPGLAAKVLAFLFRIVPRFGFLKALAFQVPPSQSEREIVASVAATQELYKKYLGDVSANRLELPNLILDTGEPIRSGAYPLADRAFVDLLRKLAADDFAASSPELGREMVHFFSGPPPRDRKAAKAWRKSGEALAKLRARFAPRQAMGVTDSGTPLAPARR